jgi:hypothetical protein
MLTSSIQGRVRIAAAFVAAGLVVELVALQGSRPTAFLAFALAGIPLVALGSLLFLYSLVSVRK